MIITDRVKGKVALVTGAAKGIGRAAAYMLAKEGAKVAVTDVEHDKAKELVEKINNEGGVAEYWAMDVGSEEEVSSVFCDVKERFGNITVLVNNAGIGGPNKPTHEIEEKEWDNLMRVNVNGVFLCTKHAIPQMREVGGGSIINMSSIYGLVGNADVPAYHASKGAVTLMTKNDALIYAKEKIRINSIHPAFIMTPLVEGLLNSFPDPDAAKKALEESHPVGHLGEPEDIGWGVIYLASDESKFVTGSELVIDGGYTAQ